MNSNMTIGSYFGLNPYRSTAAARKLEEYGFQNIACVTSGLQSVKPGTNLLCKSHIGGIAYFLDIML